MAVQIVVAGALPVSVGTGSAAALESLGYSTNGIEITEEVYSIPVPGDEHGGDEGAPIDFQKLGEKHTIRMELSKYDPAVAAKLQPKLLGGTAGQVGAYGLLLFAGSYSFRVLLNNGTFTRNYPRCILIGQPIELNAGTKFTRLRVEFEAHDNGSGVIWNSATS